MERRLRPSPAGGGAVSPRPSAGEAGPLAARVRGRPRRRAGRPAAPPHPNPSAGSGQALRQAQGRLLSRQGGGGSRCLGPSVPRQTTLLSSGVIESLAGGGTRQILASIVILSDSERSVSPCRNLLSPESGKRPLVLLRRRPGTDPSLRSHENSALGRSRLASMNSGGG